jgi:hypothetical protein
VHELVELTIVEQDPNRDAQAAHLTRREEFSTAPLAPRDQSRPQSERERALERVDATSAEVTRLSRR